MSGSYDFINSGSKRAAVEQGATFDRQITWKDESNVAIDLTGFSAVMKIYADPEKVQLIKTLASGSGLTLGGSEGTIAILISATDTAKMGVLSGGTYRLELTSGSTVTRLIEGRVDVV